LVGRFSHRLHLTHLSVVALLYFGLRRLASSASMGMLAFSVLGARASVQLSYAFFSVFERAVRGSPCGVSR
jgi:hypothetical protein